MRLTHSKLVAEPGDKNLAIIAKTNGEFRIMAEFDSMKDLAAFGMRQAGIAAADTSRICHLEETLAVMSVDIKKTQRFVDVLAVMAGEYRNDIEFVDTVRLKIGFIHVFGEILRLTGRVNVTDEAVEIAAQPQVCLDAGWQKCHWNPSSKQQAASYIELIKKAIAEVAGCSCAVVLAGDC